jgi:hypothetical protein
VPEILFWKEDTVFKLSNASYIILFNMQPITNFAKLISHPMPQPKDLIPTISGKILHLLGKVRKGHFIFMTA